MYLTIHHNKMQCHSMQCNTIKFSVVIQRVGGGAELEIVWLEIMVRLPSGVG